MPGGPEPRLLIRLGGEGKQAKEKPFQECPKDEAEAAHRASDRLRPAAGRGWHAGGRHARTSPDLPRRAQERYGRRTRSRAQRQSSPRGMVEQTALKIEHSPDADEARGFDPGNVSSRKWESGFLLSPTGHSSSLATILGPGLVSQAGSAARRVVLRAPDNCKRPHSTGYAPRRTHPPRWCQSASTPAEGPERPSDAMSSLRVRNDDTRYAQGRAAPRGGGSSPIMVAGPATSQCTTRSRECW